MLLQLDIHNIALIDEVNIEFDKGLNILTGETGAGKSIIIDSINAVLGGRVSRDIIRTGCEKATVDAVFHIAPESFKDVFEEMGVESEKDGTLILSREITQSGRNTCRINGKIVTVSLMKNIAEQLIDLHGQHDNQSLLRVESHIALLDSFGGNDIYDLKSKYSSLLKQYKEILGKIKAMSADPSERERKLDLLNFQINEINEAQLKPDEDKQLSEQRLLLSNAEKIAASLDMVYNILYSNDRGGTPALDLMNEALSHLNSISMLGDTYEDLSTRLQDILYIVEDFIGDARKALEEVEYNPNLLEEIEERLDLIFRLKRKYGNSIEKIYQFCSTAEKQLDEIIRSEQTAAELKKKRNELELALYDVCVKLNRERLKAAKILERNITAQLDDLEMKKAKFKVDIMFDNSGDSDTGRRFTVHGLDKVEFLISPNVGEPLKPLTKIASGGEMSRIMLAIKTILADVDQIPIMIFDEIDNGISGEAGLKVGEKLSYISKEHQVICVTHLAQIACMADSHFSIKKIIDEDNTKTIVTKLNTQNTIKEISRLIGGTVSTEASLKYAEEMITASKKLKKA